jgi:hypothetical protein
MRWLNAEINRRFSSVIPSLVLEHVSADKEFHEQARSVGCVISFRASSPEVFFPERSDRTSARVRKVFQFGASKASQKYAFHLQTEMTLFSQLIG